ncbi:hypothetical protein ACET3Z_003880 [Daucus carota]
MAVKTKRKKTTAAELPDEILRHEILTRLPIKSAVRFKSVCKLWLFLISQPQFVFQHLTYNSTENPNAHDLLIADKGTKLVILSRYKETKLLPFDNLSFLVGSINGLVCLYRGTNLSLWNPAIHQSKEFRLPPGHFGVPGTSLGLAFDWVGNDFKVVALCADLRSASVYCSGLDEWSQVFFEEDLFPKTDFEDCTPPFIVKGCPYWTRSRYVYETKALVPGQEYTDLVEVFLSVVKFDPRNYEFSLSPEYHWDKEDIGIEFCHQFVDLKDRVTLIVHDQRAECCIVQMFTMDGEEGCSVWTKKCIVMLDFETRGMYVSLSQGFKFDGELVYHDNGMFACIVSETEENKRIRGTTSTEYQVTCYRYAPTLFFILGMKSVHLRTQTRTPHCHRTPRRLISSLRASSLSCDH